MEIIHGLISTTHVDQHGDRMMLEALQGMAEQIALQYIPVLDNHDIRRPPLGRIIGAEVVRLPDDEYGLRATIEVFGPGDTADTLQGDGRRMPLHEETEIPFHVSYNRSFASTDDGANLVGELAKLAGPDRQPEEELQKALEPIGMVIIGAGLFVAGGIANGFLGQIGADLYNGLKEKLSRFYRGHDNAPSVVDLRLTTEVPEFYLGLERAGRLIEIHVLIDTPTEQDIIDLFTQRLEGVDRIVDEAVAKEPRLAKVYMLWKDGGMQSLYGVREDAVPVIFSAADGDAA